MSSTLCWEPADRDKGELSDKLKFALQKSGEVFLPFRVNNSDVPYFEGLRDAGIESAQKVLDAVEKHDEIILSEEY